MMEITPEEFEKKFIETIEPMTEEERYDYLTKLGFEIIGKVEKEEALKEG